MTNQPSPADHILPSVLVPSADAVGLGERLTDMAHLSSAVGHHVINAYSAIVSNAEILRLTASSRVQADPIAVADLIIRTALDASSVARHLIDYTRPICHPGVRTVELDRLIADVVEEKRATCRSRITWSSQVEPVPPVIGHRDQLRAMLGHLIRNSQESMAGAAGAIELTTSVDNRGWIALEVRDSGPGMTPEIVERAVEPFYSTKNGHVGVGLSIANGIWRRHKGTLAIRSRPGEGTTVRLCIDPKEIVFSVPR